MCFGAESLHARILIPKVNLEVKFGQLASQYFKSLKFQRYHWALNAVSARDGAGAIKEVTTAL